MIENNKLTQYKEELEKLEVSTVDTSSNYKQAEEFMLKIINDEEIQKDDKIKILKQVHNKFQLTKEEKEKLGNICEEEFSKTKQGKDEYIDNLLTEMSTDNDYIYELVPYMDYTQEHGLSYMAILRNKDKKKIKCFVSSKKELYKYEDCEKKGIYIKHDKNTSNFQVESFIKYMKGNDNVKSGTIFKKLKNSLYKYIIFPEETLYDIVSLWIMHTYVYCLFRYVPYIWLNAEAGSGKSTVLDVVKAYSFNADSNVGSTPAVVYRKIENSGSTLFLDEFENMVGEDKSLILTILKVGFKTGATVSRCSENNYEPVTFSAFSPKVFAGITDIDSVLLSRCIKINMKRVNDVSKIDEFQLTPKVKKEISEIINELHIFGLKYADEIHNLYQDKELLVFPSNYTPREKDLWKPLYAIAKIVDTENDSKTVDSILSYAEILRQELDKTKYTELTPRILKYLEILVNEQDDVKQHPDWYKLEEIYYFFRETGEFEEIKTFESLGKYLSKFEFEKQRLSYGGVSPKRAMAYYITKEKLKQLKKKHNLDTI